MFIAFEGPDNVGKSTTARLLDAAQQPDYNATKEVHAQNVADQEPGTDMPHCYDRIDWFSHMVYRLALPDRDWNDDRPRTVFAMPETHLVVMMHRPEEADFTADEVVDTPIRHVNPAYYQATVFLIGLNDYQGHNLFRSISLVEVSHKDGYRATLVDHFSAIWGPDEQVPEVVGPDALLEFLREQDRQLL